MRSEVKALLSLLRAGLWGKYDDAMSSVFPISPDSWECVFVIASQQTVTGIAFRGLDYLPDAVQPPLNLVAKWMAHVDRIEHSNLAMNETIAILYHHFDRLGVTAVLQKGQGIARMYPEPLLRECGDIDVFIPGYDGKSDPLKDFPGAARERHPDGSWVYRLNGQVVELHTRLVDLVRPECTRYVAGLIEEKGFDKVRIFSGPEVYVPSPQTDLLLLSSHILKHCFGVGIGLRQICDIAVASDFYKDDVEDEDMALMWKKTGLTKWNTLLQSFINNCLKTDNVDFSDDLLDIVLKGGNFGVYSDARVRASTGKWSRKVNTFMAFVNNVPFALKYAPGEWFWTVVKLMGGQIR